MFKDKFIQYISSEKRFSEHTIKSYSSDISQFQDFLSSEFNITNKVEEISFQLIRSWIAFLLESGINPRSVNRKISTLKTYFKFLLRVATNMIPFFLIILEQFCINKFTFETCSMTSIFNSTSNSFLRFNFSGEQHI